MITKSILILSIITNIIGINILSDRFDDALYKIEGGNYSNVIASSQNLPLPYISKKPTIEKMSERPDIKANAYLLADMDSGTVLLRSNIKDKVPIASTTKIMTAVIALEYYKLDDLVTVSGAATSQAGADVFLRTGEKITVRELLYCLLIKSGNDSAYALAEHYNTDLDMGIDKFVNLMNQKSKELGMKSTNYLDPAGLDVAGYSTAYDLFLLTKYAMKNQVFRQIVATKEYTAKSSDGEIRHQLVNSNRLVNEYNYSGAIGVKTGYIPEAGHCLVSAVRQNGYILIGVVLKTYLDTATASADESKKLFDWSESNIKW